MIYTAELSRMHEGERHTFDSECFNAADDKDAIQQVNEWAVTAVGMIGGPIELRVVQDGRGVFHKTFGDL
jgi:hypothetical protein